MNMFWYIKLHPYMMNNSIQAGFYWTVLIMPALFTWGDKDIVIKNAVASSHRKIKWDAISKLLPGTTAKMCKARWETLKNFPGLQNSAFLNATSSPSHSAHSSSSLSSSSSSPPSSSRGNGKSSHSHNSSKAYNGNRENNDDVETKHVDTDRYNSQGKASSSSGSSTNSSRNSKKKKSLHQNSNSNNSNSSSSSSSNNSNSKNTENNDRKKDKAKLRKGEKGATGDNDEIVIHVCDESRKINRDFSCDRVTLMKGMKYFESYLADTNSFEEIDISVHCDVLIFKWLMEYIKAPNVPPKLDVGNVVSILISSDFLQMRTLVDQCLAFFKAHCSDIIKSPIDLNCIGANLLTPLAGAFDPEELDLVRDKRDKLVSRLFRAKLEKLLNEKENYLYKCGKCGHLFTSEQRKWMACPKAQSFIDFHGNVIAQHTVNSSWDLRKYILSLRAQRISWRDLYWKLWARIKWLDCIVCNKRFVCSELTHCGYHAEDAIVPHGENRGFYPCCNAVATRFHTFNTHARANRSGCKMRAHVPSEKPEDQRILRIVNQRRDIMLVSFRKPPSHLPVGEGFDGGQSSSSTVHAGTSASSSSRKTRGKGSSGNNSNTYSNQYIPDDLTGAGGSVKSFESYSVQSDECLAGDLGQGEYVYDDDDAFAASFQLQSLALDGDGESEFDVDTDDDDDNNSMSARAHRRAMGRGSLRSSSSSSSSASHSSRGGSGRSNSKWTGSNSTSARRKKNSPWTSISVTNRNASSGSTYGSSSSNSSSGKSARSSRTMRNRRKSKSSAGEGGSKSNKRVQKIDRLRDDDRRRMSSLVARLTSLRTNEGGGNSGASGGHRHSFSMADAFHHPSSSSRPSTSSSKRRSIAGRR